MLTYQVGPDEAEPRHDDRFEWVVVCYEAGYYDGSGEAVGLCKQTGMLHVLNLGHCSCYGPFEDGMIDGERYTIEEFLGDKDHVLAYDAVDPIKAKVRELLQSRVAEGIS